MAKETFNNALADLQKKLSASAIPRSTTVNVPQTTQKSTTPKISNYALPLPDKTYELKTKLNALGERLQAAKKGFSTVLVSENKDGLWDIKREMDALQDEIWKQTRKEKYSAIGNITPSKIETDDFTYNYINDVDNARAKGAIGAANSGGGTRFDKLAKMDQKEINNYNHLYETEGKDAADDYLEYLDYELNKRTAEENAQFASNMANKGVGGAIAASALSVPANLAGGLGYVDALKQKAVNAITGNDKPIDYNTQAFNPSTFASSAREEVSKNIEEKTGSKVPSFLYNVGMSVADFLTAAPTGNVAMALLGGSAATSATKDAKKRGATDDQALGIGLTAGAAEAVFEKMSLGSFKAMQASGKAGAWNFVKDVLKQMGVEGSEEGLTTIANTISDALIMGDKSAINLAIQDYIGQGMSEEEATRKAYTDAANGLALDTLGGALSGGFVGSVGAVQGRQANAQPTMEQSTTQPSIEPVQAVQEVQQPIQEVQTVRPEMQQPTMQETVQPESVQPEPVQPGAMQPVQPTTSKSLPIANTAKPSKTLVPLPIAPQNTKPSPIPLPIANIENTWNEKVGQYGAIKRGENIKREIDVPKRVIPEKKTRQFVRTVLESNTITDDMVKDIKQDVLQGGMSYVPISDQSAMEYAADMMTEKNQSKAWRHWENVIDGTEQASKNSIALGENLLRTAAANGDAATVVKLTGELASILTDAGRTIQAAKMLKKIGPAGDVYYIKQTESKINRDLLKRFPKKGTQVKLNEDLVTNLLNSQNDTERQTAVDALAKDLANQVPATWMDKWNAWRYMSMLANPRTHIRNIVGNAIFFPAVQIKNAVAAPLESIFIKDGTKTKAIFVNKQYRDFAKADYANVKDEMTGSGKLNPKDIIRDNQTIFKNKTLEKIRKANFSALEKEDSWFLHPHYSIALGQYLQANNINVDTLEQNPVVLNAAREYAIKEAQKATYRDANAFSKKLASLSKGGESIGSKLGQAGIEAVMPFKQTPVNILRRGVEYSPVGLIKQLTYGVWQLQNGKINASEFIDGVSAGLTGSAILAIGAFLQGIGAVSGSLGDDDKERAFEKLTGKQEYALNIGGNSYTIDWSAPLSLPFFVGVELSSALRGEWEDITIEDVTSALSNITEPMLNLSMLQGIESLLESISYAQNGKIGAVLGSMATGYLQQALPTIGGQIARTIDDTRRTNYTDKTMGIPAGLQSFVQRAGGKIPGLASTRQPYVNEWGEKEVTESALQRGFENFISPGYFSRLDENPVNQEIQALYKNTGEKGLLPSRAGKSVTIDGTTYDLTAEEYTQFATVLGQTRYDVLDRMIQLPSYEDMDDSEKLDAFAYAYKYAQAYAKKDLKQVPMSDWMEEAYAKSNGKAGVIAASILNKVQDNTASDQTTEAMSSLKSAISGYSSYDAQEAIDVLTKNGKEQKDIRSEVTKTFKQQYMDYFRAGKTTQADSIAKFLIHLDIGYEYKDFMGWQKDSYR